MDIEQKYDLNYTNITVKVPENFDDLIKKELEDSQDTHENAYMYFLNHGYGVLKVLANGHKTVEILDCLKAYPNGTKYKTYFLTTTREIKKEIEWFIDILNEELKLPKEFLIAKLIEIGIKYYLEGKNNKKK